MVLAALYISVSTSLPTTANIKYIDIWLLFSLIFPFIIILINILLYFTKKGNNSTVKVKPMLKAGSSKEKDDQSQLSGEMTLNCIALYVNPFAYIGFVTVYLVYGIYLL